MASARKFVPPKKLAQCLPLPDYKTLASLFVYLEGGGLRRIKRVSNGVVGATYQSGGRRGYVCINYVHYLRSRVVWKLLKGADPIGHLDHINGDYSDDRIENLRDVSRHENLQNQKLRSDNTSGFKGVYFDRRRGLFYAYAAAYGVRKCVGGFLTADQAFTHRCALACANQGAFATTGVRA